MIRTFRFQNHCRDIDWEEAAAVVLAAPLGERNPEKMRRAFENSFAVCFVFDGGTLAGMGRIVSDGEYQAVLYDLCLRPEYQGRGLGTLLLEKLMDTVRGLTVLLYAVPGKQGFYRRFGFREMGTAMARFSDPERMRSMGYLIDP